MCERRKGIEYCHIIQGLKRRGEMMFQTHAAECYQDHCLKAKETNRGSLVVLAPSAPAHLCHACRFVSAITCIAFTHCDSNSNIVLRFSLPCLVSVSPLTSLLSTLPFYCIVFSTLSPFISPFRGPNPTLTRAHWSV